MSRRQWMVRAGKSAAFVDEFIENSVVAVGWSEAGSLPSPPTPQSIVERLRTAFPSASQHSLKSWAGQLNRFYNTIAIGDGVVTYDTPRRTYFLGVIESNVSERDHPLRHARQVKWTHRVHRDAVPQAARNSLGAIATLFEVQDATWGGLESGAVPIDAPIETESRPSAASQQAETAGDNGDLVDGSDDLTHRSEELIEDRIARLDWDEMQDLVAGILRAMGYKTRVSEPGPDRGVDIFASPDGLGLQEPRIFVEVKHRPQTSMGAPDVRAFLGGRQPGDRCLYVSTGGFSKDAKYEADRSSVPVRLLSLPDIRELLVDYFEQLDPETVAIVPLKRVYWPVED